MTPRPENTLRPVESTVHHKTHPVTGSEVVADGGE